MPARLIGAPLTDGVVALREISATDAELLYIWRMDSSSRTMFRQTEAVPFAFHQSVVQGYLNSETSDCWFMIEAAGTPVGTLSLYNFTDAGHTCEWGRFTVAPEARNRGYGRRALKLLMTYAHSVGVSHLTCEVLDTNAPALHLYRSLGFVEIAQKDDSGRTFLTMAAQLPVTA